MGAKVRSLSTTVQRSSGGSKVSRRDRGHDPGRHRLLWQHEGDLRGPLAEKALEPSWVADAPALLVITAVVRPTAQKYGRRAERYVLIEAEHAAQNVYMQAEALGLMPVGRRKHSPGEANS